MAEWAEGATENAEGTVGSEGRSVPYVVEAENEVGVEEHSRRPSAGVSLLAVVVE